MSLDEQLAQIRRLLQGHPVTSKSVPDKPVGIFRRCLRAIKFHAIAGWTVGISIGVFFAALVPETTCADGWLSSSIGRVGASSWHGGVRDYKYLYIFIFWGSVWAGVSVANFFKAKLWPES